jgi:trimeric autotransporter adhesin
MNNVAVGYLAASVYDDGDSDTTAVGSLRAAAEYDWAPAIRPQAKTYFLPTLLGPAILQLGSMRFSANTTANNNVAFGASAMRCNTTGSSNTALGINALCANVEGDQSVAVGINALQNQNPVGNADMNNVAVGYLAAQCTTTGCSNTALGACSLRSNTTGVSNTAVGHTALFSNTTASGNTASGSGALFANTTGSSNTAFGTTPLRFNTTGTLQRRHGPQTPSRANVEGDQSP